MLLTQRMQRPRAQHQASQLIKFRFDKPPVLPWMLITRAPGPTSQLESHCKLGQQRKRLHLYSTAAPPDPSE